MLHRMLQVCGAHLLLLYRRFSRQLTVLTACADAALKQICTFSCCVFVLDIDLTNHHLHGAAGEISAMVFHSLRSVTTDV